MDEGEMWKLERILEISWEGGRRWWRQESGLQILCKIHRLRHTADVYVKRKNQRYNNYRRHFSLIHSKLHATLTRLTILKQVVYS